MSSDEVLYPRTLGEAKSCTQDDQDMQNINDSKYNLDSSIEARANSEESRNNKNRRAPPV